MFKRASRLLSYGFRGKIAQFSTASLPLIFLTLQQYKYQKTSHCLSFSTNQTQIFPNLIEKTKGTQVILYSKQTNRPLGAGIIIHKNGIFITVSEIIESQEMCGQYYAIVPGYSNSKLNINLINHFEQEGISICQLVGNHIDAAPTQYIPISQIQQAQIGQQVYTISKDSNDINVFDSTVVLEKDQNLNRNLIDKDALVSFLPFKLLSLMTPVLMGSPLYNENGGLVGIIRRDDYFNDKVTSIDSSFLSGLIEQLKQGKSIRRPYLGVSMKTSEAVGSFIIKINADSPADQAGLKLGEIIKEMNGIPVYTSADVSKILAFNLNKTYVFKVDKDGKQRFVNITPT